MKLPGRIWAVYILLLATMPCCSTDQCRDVRTDQATGHEQGDEDCGSCSPFFSCEGCATATVVYDSFQFELKPLLVKPVFTSYLQPCLSQADFDFWQPPKLG